MPETVFVNPVGGVAAARARAVCLGDACAQATRVCLFGAAPDTGNLGVSALCASAVAGVLRERPEARVTVFDHGRGVRACASGDPRVARCGAVHTRRPTRAEGLWRMRLSNLVGGAGNAGVGLVRRADVVLDASGGDSFTDMYGAKRFRTVTLPKLIAIEAGVPLVLLPQTYGAFSSRRARRVASWIVRRAAGAWARDARSFEALKELLGDDFDPARHRCAVDMAFGLGAREAVGVPGRVRAWLDADARPIGINVSGLIYNDPAGARSRYGFRADYREVMSRVLAWALADTDRKVVLIPHVHAPAGHPESDRAACEALARGVAPEHAGRVAVLAGELDESETKWAIGRMEWVCATRMHACIAALSSGVPVGAVAYSCKTAGVLETCGVGGSVIDPRALTTEQTVSAIVRSWETRAEARAALGGALPGVMASNRAFFRDLAGMFPGAGAAPEREAA